MKIKSLLISAIIATTSTVSFAENDAQLFMDAKNWINTIEEKETFPLERLHYVKSQGNTFLVSGNGHYAIFGDIKIVDVWNRKVIKSANDLKKSNRVSMGIFKKQAKELMSTVTYGRGSKDVYIFTNPKSKYSAAQVKQVLELGDQYKFYFINLVAIKGSAEIAKKLECNDNGVSAQAIIFNDYSKLENITNCDGVKEKLQASLLLSKVIGVKKVPTVVAPNGFLHEGFTDELEVFLENNYD